METTSATLIKGLIVLGPSRKLAIASGFEDALRPLGVKIDALPMHAARLRALIRAAEVCQPAAE